MSRDKVGRLGELEFRQAFGPSHFYSRPGRQGAHAQGTWPLVFPGSGSCKMAIDLDQAGSDERYSQDVLRLNENRKGRSGFLILV